jgi:MFS family permease
MSGSMRSGFSALRHREFRLVAVGNMVSQLGTWQQYVAMLWLARELTSSSFIISIVFAAQWVPFIVLSPFTGVVADRLDRRALVLWGNLAMIVPAALLGVLTQTDHIGLVTLGVLIVIGNSAQALTQPAAAAFVPSLVPATELHAAVALNMGMSSSTRVIGPAIGGIVVRSVGVEWGFYLNAISFLAVAVACSFVASRGRPAVNDGEGYLDSIRIGMRYLRANKAAMRILVMLTTITFFFVHAALLPSLVKDVLDGDAGTYGLASSAPGVGFVVAAVLTVALVDEALRVRFLFLSALAAGLATFVIGASTALPVTLAALVLFGGSFMTLNTLSSTLLLATSDDEYRGRVMGLFGVVSTGMFAFNAVAAGAMSKVIGLTRTIWGAGLLAMVFTLMHWAAGGSSVIRRALIDRRGTTDAEEG